MDEIINELAKKGFHICIIPQIQDKEWWWSAGVYIGMSNRAEWIRPKEADGPLGSFSDYYKALEVAVSYCNNYKSKVQHANKKSSK